MSTLYEEARHRVNHHIDLDHVNESFKKYFLEVMHYLANLHKCHTITTYRVYCCTDNVYYGIQLDKLRFRASNKYELWIKIYNYVSTHCNDRMYVKEYMKRLYYQYTLDEQFINYYETNPNQYDAMIKTIDYELEFWESGDSIWWEEDDTQYI